MKRLFLLGIIGLFLIGCSDALTQYIKDHKYTPITPVSTGYYVGSIYPENDLSTAPILLLPDVINQPEANKLMKDLKRKVTLRTEKKDIKYDIGTDVAIIGYVSDKLKTSGVKKFKVHVGDAAQYILSQARFYSLLNNMYKKLLGSPSNVNGKYYVYGLLEVSSLEYEFFSENETKISANTLAEINKIQAKLGPEWKVTKEGNLGFNEPRFIGFRAEKIDVSAKHSKTLKLDISRIYLLDEMYAKPLNNIDTCGFTQLKRRNNSQFEYENPKQLKIALLFEVEGFRVEANKTKLEGDVSIVSASKVVAKAPLQTVFEIDGWKYKSQIVCTGEKKVLDFLGYGTADIYGKMPYLAVLDDFQKTEAPSGDIDIIIHIKDCLSNKEKSQRISVQFRKK